MREHYDDTQVELAMSADAPVLCLASASPRRQTLLSSIGVHACVMPSDIDETPLDAELPEAYVERLAVAKVQAAVGKTTLPVLGSDTAVVIDGVILGKPNDQQHAAHALWSHPPGANGSSGERAAGYTLLQCGHKRYYASTNSRRNRVLLAHGGARR
ncbi:hypothetical protein GCM10011382_09450 [Vreelandella lutescens]|uniref:Maf-like protein n=1 Tax=Vreelandella lutescens TaxID=1602943 RepID=A0ABQ1NNC2_9GAMM|nr:hypothetical protein GCM10011382_09450 [Halomonas lutescens]